jgi:hypothetical protein
MLGSEVPPCRTITLGGGQGVGVPAAGTGPSEDAIGVEVEAEEVGAAEALSQFAGMTVFLWVGLLLLV